jgi:hypothetical protein
MATPADTSAMLLQNMETEQCRPRETQVSHQQCTPTSLGSGSRWTRPCGPRGRTASPCNPGTARRACAGRPSPRRNGMQRRRSHDMICERLAGSVNFRGASALNPTLLPRLHHQLQTSCGHDEHAGRLASMPYERFDWPQQVRSSLGSAATSPTSGYG